MFTLFCGLAALVIDLGFAQDLQRQAQNAADSGALGAAQFLARVPNPAAPTAGEVAQARQLASAYVTADGWSAGTNAVAVDSAAHTVTVQLAPVQSPNIFAGAIGATPPQVGARAHAVWPGVSSVPCSLCVLSDADLQNGSIAVTGGGSAMFAGALSANPQGSITVAPSGTIGVAGTKPTRGTYSPAITSIVPFTDPYAGLTLPPAGTDFTQPVRPTPIVGAVCLPGNYSDVTNCGSFQAGGTYVLTGSAKLTGRSTLDVDDVLFYFTCSRVFSGQTYPQACAVGGQAGATFGGAGNGTVTINGRRSGPYAGFAIIYDRNNTSSLRYVGNGALRVNGAVYAAAATPDMRGNGSAEIHGALIVGSLSFSGNPSALTVTQYDVTPPPPTATQTVHLTG